MTMVLALLTTWVTVCVTVPFVVTTSVMVLTSHEAVVALPGTADVTFTVLTLSSGPAVV